MRLEAAKSFQTFRLQYILHCWKKWSQQPDNQFTYSANQLESFIKQAQHELTTTETTQDLLLLEAQLTKRLYKLAAKATQYPNFTRVQQKGTDPANQFLDHGNYLAYGLGATALWVLGIPHGLAILHGKTRRGGLVFDVADLIKDAIVLPMAFIAASLGESEQEFRQRCIQHFSQQNALDVMIDQIKIITDQLGA